MKRINTIIRLATATMLLLNWAYGQMTNWGNLQLHPGANISLRGDFINNGTLNDNGLLFLFNGAANQNIGGTAVSSINNLSADNAAGVTLNQNLNVKTRLNLVTGALDLNSRTLTVTSVLLTAVSRSSGYVVSEKSNNSSKFAWNIGTTLGAFTVPFGTAAGEYIPFVLNQTAGNAGLVTVSTYATAFNNTPYPFTPNLVTNVLNDMGADNSANIADRFWQIDKTGPSGTATLTFTATPAEVGSLSTLRAQRWNPLLMVWEAALPGQTSTATSATVPGVTQFSPWVLSDNNSPLPVELLDFTAYPVGDEVALRWVTASEINSSHFTVEKSLDKVAFEEVLELPAAGSSREIRYYAAKDAEPFSGVSYYRLKQTDRDAKSYYSGLREVHFGDSYAFDLAVFPNPANADRLRFDVSSSSGGELHLEFLDVVGRVCYSQRLIVPAGGGIFRPESGLTLPSGLYTIVATMGNATAVKKVVIQTSK